MNKLERLLRGDKATFNRKPINHVADLRCFASSDPEMIMISYNDSYRFISNNTNDAFWGYVKFVEPEKQRYIEDGLKEGDVLVGDNGEKLVLGIIGKGILTSEPDEFNVAGTPYTLHELIEYGYKLKVKDAPSKPKKKMTVSEIEKALGEEVEIISEQ